MERTQSSAGQGREPVRLERGLDVHQIAELHLRHDDQRANGKVVRTEMSSET